MVAVTDANRNVIERREYEPYGAQLTPAVKDGPGYTGHVQDAATGLVQMQQRYYDPGIGRFLSVDPVATNLNNGALFNRYMYAANNPYRFYDPDGRCTGSRITNSGGTCRSTGELTTKATSAGRKVVGAAFDGAGSENLPDNRAFRNLANSAGIRLYDAKAVVGAPEGEAVRDVSDAKERSPRARVVLLGYSAGGDAAIRVAGKLAEVGIRTDALVTFDPHNARTLVGYHSYALSGSVGVALNFYQRNPITTRFGIPYGMNPFHGGDISCSACFNANLTGLPVDHTSIVQYSLRNYGSQIQNVISP